MSNIGLPHIYEIIKHPEEYLQGYPLKTYYRGIVEDVEDPEKRGRVRVRIESVWRAATGDSTFDDGESVPVNDLPWADVPRNRGGNKYGVFDVPEKGDAVIVVFENGDPSFPLVIGGWYGTNEVPLAALGQPGDTADALKGLDVAPKAGGGTIQEPANPADPNYPDNKVFRTSNGLLVEIDNTPGSERINIAHPSGTWWEIHPDGSLVVSAAGERYTIVATTDSLHVKASRDVSIDGAYSRKVGAGETIEVTGTQNITVTGIQNVTVNGVATRTTTGALTENVNGIYTLNVLGVLNIITPAALVLQALSYLLQGPAAAAAASFEVKANTITLSNNGTGSPVVTTGTHPFDFITGIPIVGVPTVLAGPP